MPEEDGEKQSRFSALFRMMPFVGILIAHYFVLSGSLQQFVVNQGWTLQSNVYNFSTRLSITDRFTPNEEKVRNAPENVRLYLLSDSPNTQDFKKNYNRQAPLTRVARIPTKDARVHDAELCLASKNTLSSPTVVLYHGNDESRSSMLPEATIFLEKGYNVLLSSYAGDRTFGDRPRDNIPSSEAAMRKDAEADFQFLRDLGCETIGIYGYSLGGSQAANLAHFIDLYNQQHLQNPVEVPVIILDKTFSSASDVAGRFVENIKNSRFLGMLVTMLTKQHYLLEKQDQLCDGLDTKRKLASFKTLSKTPLIILGAIQDKYMGGKINDQYDRSRSMSNDLADAAKKGVFARVILFFQKQGASHATRFVTTDKVQLAANIPETIAFNS